MGLIKLHEEFKGCLIMKDIANFLIKLRLALDFNKMYLEQLTSSSIISSFRTPTNRSIEEVRGPSKKIKSWHSIFDDRTDGNGYDSIISFNTSLPRGSIYSAFSQASVIPCRQMSRGLQMI